MPKNPMPPEEVVRLWDLYVAGETAAVMARRMNRPFPSVNERIETAGAIRPVIPQRPTRALSAVEREEISRGLAAGVSLRCISRRLGGRRQRSHGRWRATVVVAATAPELRSGTRSRGGGGRRCPSWRRVTLCVTWCGRECACGGMTPREYRWKSFEQFVAAAMEAEGLIVSEAIRFPVQRRTRKAIHDEVQTHGHEGDLIGARADRLVLATV